MKVFQSNISYPRAIASCLPGVGFLVGLYNIFEVKVAVQNLKMKAQLAHAFDPISSLGSKTEEQIAQEQKERRISHINLIEKAIDYSKCGVVSNLLSAATAVTLVALEILSAPGGISLAVGCSFFAFCNYAFHSSAEEKLKLLVQTTFPKPQRDNQQHAHFAPDQVSGSHASPAAFHSRLSDNDDPDFDSIPPEFLFDPNQASGSHASSATFRSHRHSRLDGETIISSDLGPAYDLSFVPPETEELDRHSPPSSPSPPASFRSPDWTHTNEAQDFDS